ncbi:hypothetical protein CPC08DRAFT_706660 [Agrocybe pediades]|nr:hypothetical protein CPC08DRAFT_706660 [Agrocybe pediades]
MHIRPTLRPVDWSNVDSKGHTIRRARSSDDEDDDSSDHPSRKKYKAVGQAAIYYPPTLTPAELMWRQRYGFLYQRGYQLRSRYHPEWTPLISGNGRHHHSGEDHIMQILPQVLDAVRLRDGLVVCIKMIQDLRKLQQVQITQYFSTDRMMEDSANHVVPCYDAFLDGYSSHVQFIVMPVLRRFDDPEFLVASEVMDFVTQVTEGLAFLHKNNVAHHNLNADHIMMDAKALVPTGWHFVSHFCEPDGMTKIVPRDRKNHPVRYYFIGFGSCYHINPRDKPLVLNIGGTDDDVPELFKGTPYDPFKLDVYTLGNVLLKELYDKYEGIEFLHNLIEYMRTQDFEKRPSAAKVLARWYAIRHTLNEEELEETSLVLRQGVKPRKRYSPEQGVTSQRAPGLHQNMATTSSAPPRSYQNAPEQHASGARRY